MTNHDDISKLDGWALILGASSGFGAAAARAFARAGLNIVGVHLDRRATMENVRTLQADIEAMGRQAWFYNVNAADEGKRNETLDDVKAKFAERNQGDGFRVMLHSLAFGTLLPFWTDEEGASLIGKRHIDMTMDVMANSLVYWSQDVLRRDMFLKNSRIYAMTSSGSHNVWQGYGAVSGAKAALEAHIRQLAIELGRYHITCNAICAGVTDTPALRKIPGSDQMIETATRKIPLKRLTTPEDVASCMVNLSMPGTYWMTGNTLFVDGGEDIAG